MIDPIGKFKRSWLLFKTSLAIMTANKRLLVFPIVVFLFTMLVLLFFLAPVVLRPTSYSYVSVQHWEAISHSLFSETTDANGRVVQSNLTPGAMVYLAFMYFVSMFCATFFNVAFYHEILAALGGGQVSIRRGLKFAGTRLKAILMWTLFAGLVGLIIQQLEQRLSFVGRIIARFIGMAWSIAAVFVIPIIVRDEQNTNPINMLKSSAGILKRTWGEALIGYAGVSLASGLILLVSLIGLLGSLFLCIALNNYWLIAVVGVFWLLGIFLLSYLAGVAGQIYKCALYLYAAQGIVSEPFSAEMLNSAWKFKNNKSINSDS
ncbi:MAG: DUF6159 family protein [Limisphaerales bacterium]